MPSTSGRVSPPRWVWPVGLTLAVVGLGLSAYLTQIHYSHGEASLACPGTGTINCADVLTSPEAVIFGIPVAVLGLAFFVGMVPLNLPVAWRSASPLIRQGRLAATVVGVGMIFYLVYTEFFTLHHVCLWCTAVHVLTVVLFAVTVFGTLLSAPSEQAWDDEGSTDQAVAHE